jgi:TPR repeat protein
MNASPRLQPAHPFGNPLVRWALALLGLLLALPAFAQTLAEGDAAFDRRDYATAARIYLTEPAGANQTRAWARLGYLYRSGQGVSKDDHEALKWLGRAAAQDNAFSQNALGLMYRNGEGVAVNNAEAHKLFTRAALAGYGSAYNNLGAMYRDGVYVARDPAEAMRLFRLGAGKGNIYSQNNLGVMYRDGVGVPRDPKEAAVWFRLAVNNPLDDEDTRRLRPTAQRNLAALEGTGSAPADASASRAAGSAATLAEGDAAFDRKDYKLAARIYATNPPGESLSRALVRLGYLYLNGNGVGKDDKAAFQAFRRAADLGNAIGQNALGNAYRRGDGVAQDAAAALLWHRASASQGYVWGEFNLAIAYKDGAGVATDAREARRWFDAVLANAQNDDEGRRAKVQAQEWLARLPASGTAPLVATARQPAPQPAAAPAVTTPAQSAAVQGAASQAEQLRKENEELRRRQQETEAQVAELIRRAQAPAPVAAPVKAINAHALVLGNSAYAGSSRLPNPANDARAVAAKLRSLGFNVTEVLDTTRIKLASALTAFSRSAARADLSLLFYAGHGVQVNGTNYILPVDMDMGDVESVVLQGISLNSVVEQYLPGDTKLVLLDACRDNPLARSNSRGVSRGLAPINVSKGTLIAYSTKDGATAEDGSSKNSPFTEALLEHLGDPDDISVVLRKVREQVLRKTNNRQEPWDYGSLTGGALVLSSVRGRP